MFANDIAIMAETEEDLRCMLSTLQAQRRGGGVRGGLPQPPFDLQNDFYTLFNCTF